MTHYMKLTLCALAVLAPTLASAQTRAPTAGLLLPAVQAAEVASPQADLRRPGTGPVTHGIANQSICPPGSSLHWSINTDPTEPGPPLGANGYVLGCN
ncbi:hypothetical protein [Hasllibacter sp. MH4015]|uniref:hypothetical protein n=1 Tax=Hasllibacter sp. MH4015 TaxID=2854029 RepID=UPI001CD29F6A|nr:hypothetical protein [Hasllibacter sp. MH4015]